MDAVRHVADLDAARSQQGRTGAEWLARRNDEPHARRLMARRERLGHLVVLEPAA
jgi:hypothetical protein